MRNKIGNQNRTYTFDFTKKYVKRTAEKNETRVLDGKLDKFTIASILDNIKYRYYVVGIMDVKKYDELKEQLLNDLEEKNYEDVTIIK